MVGLGAFFAAGAVKGFGDSLIEQAQQRREDALIALQQQREDELYNRRRGDQLADRNDERSYQERLAADERKRAAGKLSATRDNLNAVYNSGDPFFSILSAEEGAGNPSTLWDHAQRPGGKFEGVDVSSMTIGEALEFADVNGPYARWVKETNPDGELSTPMGEAQIVGRTLRSAAQQMGLSMDTPFNQETQRKIALHLADQRLARAKTQEEKRKQLRLEWPGFQRASDSQVDAAIDWLENRDRRRAAIDVVTSGDVPAGVANATWGAVGLGGLNDESEDDFEGLSNGQINQVQDFFGDDDFGYPSPTQAQVVSEVERLMRETPNLSLTEAYVKVRDAWTVEERETARQEERTALGKMWSGEDTKTVNGTEMVGRFDYGEPRRQVPPRDPSTPTPPREPESPRPSGSAMPEGVTEEQVLEEARQALADGRNKDLIVQRLRQFGIDPRKL